MERAQHLPRPNEDLPTISRVEIYIEYLRAYTVLHKSITMRSDVLDQFLDAVEKIISDIDCITPIDVIGPDGKNDKA